MTIAIRFALEADIPRLCELLAELFSIEADFSPDREKQARGLTMLLADKTGASAVFVAVVAGKVIGMATIQTLVSTAEGGRVGLVEDVIVFKQFRGKGVGALLLGHIVEWGRERCLKRLQLLADRNNHAAVDFYLYQGWQKTDLNCMRLLIA